MNGGKCATMWERFRRVNGTVAVPTSFAIARKYQFGFQESPIVLLSVQMMSTSPPASVEGTTPCSPSAKGEVLYFMATLFSIRRSRHIISIPS